jgi:hypothetical protein
VTEIKLSLRNTFSECIIAILTTNFHILYAKVVKCLIYSFTATQYLAKFVSATQYLAKFVSAAQYLAKYVSAAQYLAKFVSARLENFTLLRSTPSTANNKDSVLPVGLDKV